MQGEETQIVRARNTHGESIAKRTDPASLQFFISLVSKSTDKPGLLNFYFLLGPLF